MTKLSVLLDLQNYSESGNSGEYSFIRIQISVYSIRLYHNSQIKWTWNISVCRAVFSFWTESNLRGIVYSGEACTQKPATKFEIKFVRCKNGYLKNVVVMETGDTFVKKLMQRCLSLKWDSSSERETGQPGHLNVHLEVT